MIEYQGLKFPEDKIKGSDAPQWLKLVKHLDVALKHVTRWKNAVDVGAHAGLYARAMAEKFGTVYAYEPSRSAYDCLKLNAPQNVVSECYALGDKRHAFGLVNNKHGMVTIGESRERAGWETYGIPGGWTQMVMLDDLHLPRVDFLKIDADGYDLGVILGAWRLIMRDKPIVMVEQYDKKLKVIHKYFPQTVTDYLTKSLEMKLVDRVKHDLVFGWT